MDPSQGWGAGGGLHDPPACMEHKRVRVYSEPRCVDEGPFNCAYIPSIRFQITCAYLTLQDAGPDLLVLAERNGVLVALLGVFLAVLGGRVGGRRRSVVRAAAAVGGLPEQLAEVLRVGVGELLGDQPLVQ